MIDKLSYSSRLRYKSPCLKAFFAVGTLLLCVITRSVIISLMILFIMGSLTVFVGGTSPNYYLKLMKLPLVFLFLSTISIIVSISREPLSIGAIHILNHYLSIPPADLFFGINLFLSALGSVSCLYFLILTTPFSDLLYVLEKIRCPSLIMELLLLTYRFIFILHDIATGIFIAQKSRLSNRNFKTAIHATGGLFQILLIRAIKKSGYLYDSMESRCYDGKVRVLREHNKASVKEILQVVVIEITLVIFCLR